MTNQFHFTDTLRQHDIYLSVSFCLLSYYHTTSLTDYPVLGQRAPGDIMCWLLLQTMSVVTIQHRQIHDVQLVRREIKALTIALVN